MELAAKQSEMRPKEAPVFSLMVPVPGALSLPHAARPGATVVTPLSRFIDPATTEYSISTVIALKCMPSERSFQSFRSLGLNGEWFVKHTVSWQT